MHHFCPWTDRREKGVITWTTATLNLLILIQGRGESAGRVQNEQRHQIVSRTALTIMQGFIWKLMGTGCGYNKLTFSCWFLAGLALPHCIQNSTNFPSHLFQNWMQKKNKNQSLYDWRHFFTAHAAQRKQNIQVHLKVWQNHLTNVRQPFLKCCSTCYQTSEGPVSRGTTQKFSILALVIASPSKATVCGNMFILLPKTSLPTTLTSH